MDFQDSFVLVKSFKAQEKNVLYWVFVLSLNLRIVKSY